MTRKRRTFYLADIEDSEDKVVIKIAEDNSQHIVGEISRGDKSYNWKSYVTLQTGSCRTQTVAIATLAALATRSRTYRAIGKQPVAFGQVQAHTVTEALSLLTAKLSRLPIPSSVWRLSGYPIEIAEGNEWKRVQAGHSPK